MADLAVLIAARHEQWLKPTVDDLLAHSHADTDIIVLCDGEPPLEPLPIHPRLFVLLWPTPIGQRAAINVCAAMADAEFICKVDAHVAVADGWDVELIRAARELGRDVVQIPAQHNLHVFDWVCQACQSRTYQGPTPIKCDHCGVEQRALPQQRQMVWNALRRRTETWCFDATLHFQYDGRIQTRAEQAAAARGEPKPEFLETMSCLGACWFLSRAYYWQIGGLDESFGSWGQMGQELACKAWLSGGRMVTNRRTWFSHLFRTQGLDFGFPYPLDNAQVAHARDASRALWFNNAWSQQIYPLSWLVERFYPIKGWTKEQVDALPQLLPETRRNQILCEFGTRLGEAFAKRYPEPTKGLVYYSDCKPDPLILDAVRAQLRAVTPGPIASVTLQPVDFGHVRIVLPIERSYLAMFKQILAGLEALDTEYAFLVEHDVMYHASHFDFVPPRDDVYYYNLNVWKIDASGDRAVTYETKQTSGLCANRQLLIDHYRKRIARVERDGFSRRIGFEPGSHGRAERIDDVPSDVWRSAWPNLDIRHDRNLTATRWSRDQFRDARHCQGWTEADQIPGWGTVREVARLWHAPAASASTARADSTPRTTRATASGPIIAERGPSPGALPREAQ